MRVFVTGKGGVGKTTISAALVSALRASGVDVLAVDADGSPNLALALGAGDPETLPAVANERPPGGKEGQAPPRLSPGSLEEYTVATPSGAELLQTGRIERSTERCLCCGSHATAREVVAALPSRESRVVVVDLEPGANDVLWTKPGPGDVVVAVTEASLKSRRVAANTLNVVRELGVRRTVVVANKLRPDEVSVVRDAFPDTEVVEIAYDPSLDRAVPGVLGPDGVVALLEGLSPPRS